MKVTPSQGREQLLDEGVRTSLSALLSDTKGEGATLVTPEEKYVKRVLDLPITLALYDDLKYVTKAIGVTKNFREVIDYFKVPVNETPQGFRIEYVLERDGLLRVDLVRDIGYDKNGQKRPTNLLFSADSANPYEVGAISNLIVNLTCNPGIIYDLFINNPKANVGAKFKTRDEVMGEIGRILGPGADISVELNNPFDDVQKCLDEAEKFREMLSPYRVVIKVPHTGPVNMQNMGDLLEGDKMFKRAYGDGLTADMVHGHNLALKLREHGFRINFTLMFEPYQTALALQAKPYFINSFIRHRQMQSVAIMQYLEMYRLSDDKKFLVDLRKFFVEKDYLPPSAAGMDLFDVKKMGERIVKYRQIEEGFEGDDGLDAVRHNLRVLRNCNLPDTRLIICSMEGETMYPAIDSMLTEDEFVDMIDRVVITAEPEYLARFTSTNQVISYQRRFLNAAKGAL
ncbi:MAG: transaldolase family protein [Syntrophales bacterium]